MKQKGAKHILVNLSNHPSSAWSEKQKKVSEKYGKVYDVKFPYVNPNCSENDIKDLAHYTFAKVIKMKPDYVLCAGEFTLVYALVDLFKKANVGVITSCSERIVIDETVNKNGEVTAKKGYAFVRYREY